MFFGDEDHKALLAICIGEWTTAIEHIEATQDLLPMYQQPAVLRRMKREQVNLLHQWASVRRLSPFDGEALIADARAYATERAADIDALLEEKGVS